jgi:hypothetical protein
MRRYAASVGPSGGAATQARRTRDVVLVLVVQAMSIALIAGWLISGNPMAPDHGLQQIDLLMLDERVPGITAVDGRPTMVVVTGQRCPPREPQPRGLDLRYSLVVTPDRAVARTLALPDAAERCSPGYALLDGDSVVRYRT